MLLHGWTADAHDWSWQLPVLESRYRVVCVDLRGHGRSEVMLAGGYSPASYVADIKNMILSQYGGQRFTLIGHSMGAQIAALLADERPDLVDAVVSVDGSLGFSPNLTSFFQKAADDLSSGDPGLVVPPLFELLYDADTPPALKRWHARRVEGMRAHVVRESFGPQFLGPDQVGIGKRSELLCKRLSVPVYHLCRDPEQAKRMRSWFANPKSKVDLWTGAGHWIMQDRPADVNVAITSWLDTI